MRISVWFLIGIVNWVSGQHKSKNFKTKNYKYFQPNLLTNASDVNLFHQDKPYYARTKEKQAMVEGVREMLKTCTELLWKHKPEACYHFLFDSDYFWD